jgi:hypothetical protein
VRDDEWFEAIDCSFVNRLFVFSAYKGKAKLDVTLNTTAQNMVNIPVLIIELGFIIKITLSLVYKNII